MDGSQNGFSICKSGKVSICAITRRLVYQCPMMLSSWVWPLKRALPKQNDVNTLFQIMCTQRLLVDGDAKHKHLIQWWACFSQTKSPWESNAGFVLQCMKTHAAERPCLPQPLKKATVGKTRRCNHGTMVALGYWFLKARLELKIAFHATCVSMQICVICRCTTKLA